MSSASVCPGPVVALVGPTGSGKTALSLSLADYLPLEIVACDSRTVYRHMDIGTAKPSIQEQQQVPHHLLDVVDPQDNYTAVQYQEQGRQAIQSIIARGRLPLICGGSGLYARMLLEGWTVPAVPPQPELRTHLQNLAAERGNEFLHKQLQEQDPLSAARINCNDRFRLVRALEVSLVTGQPFSSLATRRPPPYRTIWIGLTSQERSQLYERIQKRLNQQIKSGMVEEVDSLLKRFGPLPSLLRTINYREMVAYLQGQIGREQAIEDCLRHNRQLAKRQLVWFRGNEEIAWFAIDQLSPNELLDKVFSYIQPRLHPDWSAQTYAKPG